MTVMHYVQLLGRELEQVLERIGLVTEWVTGDVLVGR
jgi:hypothetical protein